MQDTQDPQTKASFWCSHCGNKAKCLLLIALAASFGLQTYFVYSDPAADEPLTPIAQQGRRIWYAKNCQSCHQLYGFGGFLGPDLTNAAPGLTPERLEDVLINGTKQMPAFHMEADEIEAMSQFLIAMNYSGRGQARPVYEGDPTQILALFETEVDARLAAGGPSSAATGFDLVRARACNACHIPFRRYSNGAVDMSKIAGRLGDDDIMLVLKNGKGTAMPKPVPELTIDECNDLNAYFKWLAENRQQLLEALDMGDTGKINWSTIPAWEFQ